MKSSIKRVATRYMSKGQMVRTAGEVRFVKDNSNDASSWAWKQGPSERNMTPDHVFNPTKKKDLAKVLRSTTASMGHAMSAYSTFTKIKSADVSPDGNLGGKGYIQKIMDMRKQYMNVVEALSALSDTIYDEVSAPHWAAISRQETDEDKAEVAQIMQDAQEIKENPEGWAEEQEENMDDDHKPMGKKASQRNADNAFTQLWETLHHKKPEKPSKEIERLVKANGYILSDYDSQRGVLKIASFRTNHNEIIWATKKGSSWEVIHKNTQTKIRNRDLYQGLDQMFSQLKLIDRVATIYTRRK